MDNFQKDIDDRANLTLSNRFELLLFRLGASMKNEKSELFGINVFKLREIVPMPTFTRPAGMKPPLMGMVNIRDQVIPVIDLSAVAGCKPETGLNILLITEYARSVQAFAVESVRTLFVWTGNRFIRQKRPSTASTSPVLPVWMKTKTVTIWRWCWMLSRFSIFRRRITICTATIFRIRNSISNPVPARLWQKIQSGASDAG
jgi:chemotaxis signal transduction protein